MKIELDLSNRAELLRQQKEFKTALDIIETALRGFKGDDSANGNYDLFKAAPLPATDNIVARIASESALLAKMPQSFTIKNVQEYDSAYTRDRAKNLLKKLLKHGKIQLQQQGNGSKPSTYLKIG
jgi:hypothetical protein